MAEDVVGVCDSDVSLSLSLLELDVTYSSSDVTGDILFKE